MPHGHPAAHCHLCHCLSLLPPPQAAGAPQASCILPDTVLASFCSGGKDSCYNMVLCQRYGHEVRWAGGVGRVGWGVVPDSSHLRRPASAHLATPALSMPKITRLQFSPGHRTSPPCHRSWPWPTCCRPSRRRMTSTAGCTRQWATSWWGPTPSAWGCPCTGAASQAARQTRWGGGLARCRTQAGPDVEAVL